MHPRSQIKTGIKTLLQTVSGLPPVYVARARDLRRGESEAVIVYVPRETISQLSRNGEQATPAPVSRDMTVELVVVVAGNGDGEEAAARADEITRVVELAIAADTSELQLVSTDIGFSEGAEMRAIATMTYSLNVTDNMES